VNDIEKLVSLKGALTLLLGTSDEAGLTSLTADDSPPIYRDQFIILQPRQRARDDFAHRSDARGDLLIGVRERELQTSFSALPDGGRFVEQPARKPIINITQRQGLNQFGAFAQPHGQVLQRRERDLRMLEA
jgi:hypothetical protein